MADVEHPTEGQLDRVARSVQLNDDWTQLFPGLARLAIEHDEGATYTLKVVKKGSDAAPVRVVKPGEPGAEDAVTILKYNLLDQYPFGLKVLGEKAGANQYEAQALVHLLGLKAREDCFKEFRVDKVTFAHYSQEALRELRAAIEGGRLKEARLAYSEFQRSRRSTG